MKLQFTRSLIGALLLAGACTLANGEPEPSHSADAHAPGRATSHRSFADVERWSKVFDDPKRAEWQKPDEVIAALNIKQGQEVADLGAGTGYFLAPLARAVGSDGTLYAVEVEASLVDHLRQRAEAGELDQVIPLLASKDNPRLPRGRLDLVVIIDTFHHLDRRAAYLPRLAEALTPTGRVAIIDWRKEELPEGPPLDHKLARDEVIAEMKASGFTLLESPEILPYQYFLVFRRPALATH